MPELIVVGGGPAGVTAALRARELGATVTLVERGRLGGACTNEGCAPTRVLAKAARLVRESEQFHEFGLHGAAPTVDLGELLNHVQQTIYRLQEKKQVLAHLEEAGVKVITEAGATHFEDPHTLVCASGQRLSGDQFILCIGGHARRLKFEGSDLALTHNDVWTLKHLPKSVIVVGAAATGCQLASIFDSFGSQVTVLELAPRIVPGEDESVSKELARAFKSRNLQVITGIGGVERLEATPTGKRAIFRLGDQPHTLEAEAILFAAGWVGNIEGLGLEAAGVQTERGYIVVDQFLRSTASHIFAAGDVTGRMMLVQSAGYEARIAAENAVLGPTRAYEHRIVPHGGFTDPEYGGVGLTETQARTAEPDCLVAETPYSDLDRPVIDGLPLGFCKLIVSRNTHRLLGAHVVGEQAVEVVQLIATGMAAGLRIEQLAELELAYPTFTEIVGLTARQLVRRLNASLEPQWPALGSQLLAVS